MTQFKKYSVYLDDGISCFRVAIPAPSKQAAAKYCDGNGRVVCVDDVSSEYPISSQCVADALARYGFGKTEMDLVVRTLSQVGITD